MKLFFLLSVIGVCLLLLILFFPYLLKNILRATLADSKRDTTIISYDHNRNKRKIIMATISIWRVFLLWAYMCLALFIITSHPISFDVVLVLLLLMGVPGLIFLPIQLYYCKIYRDNKKSRIHLRLFPDKLEIKNDAGYVSHIPKEEILYYKIPFHRNKAWIEIACKNNVITIPFVFSNIAALQKQLDTWNIEQKQIVKRKADNVWLEY